jgi:hypothetical protein
MCFWIRIPPRRSFDRLSRIRLPSLAALLLLALATPAEACFPWCIFGSPQPDSPPSALQAMAEPPETIALVVAPARIHGDQNDDRQELLR